MNGYPGAKNGAPESEIAIVDHRKMVPDRQTAVARAAVPLEISAAVFAAVDQALRRPNGQSILDLRQFRRHRHIKKTGAGPSLDLRLIE